MDNFDAVALPLLYRRPYREEGDYLFETVARSPMRGVSTSSGQWDEEVVVGG